MTPEQSQQVESVKMRIRNMRYGGTAQQDIPPALFREGWAAAAVREAFEQLDGGPRDG